MSFYQSLAISFILANLFCWITFYCLYKTGQWIKKFLIQNAENRVCNSVLKVVDRNQPYIKVEPFTTSEGVEVIMPQHHLGSLENPCLIEQSENLAHVDWAVIDTPTALRRGNIIW